MVEGVEEEETTSPDDFRFLPVDPLPAFDSWSSALTSGFFVALLEVEGGRIEVEEEGGPVQKSTWC